MTSELRIVPATPELLERFYGKPTPFTLRGHVAMVGDRVLGIGGVSYIDGQPVAFSDWKDELSRKDRARCFRFLEAQFAKHLGPLYALCTGPQSRRLLERLGFRDRLAGDASSLMLRAR